MVYVQNWLSGQQRQKEWLTSSTARRECRIKSDGQHWPKDRLKRDFPIFPKDVPINETVSKKYSVHNGFISSTNFLLDFQVSGYYASRISYCVGHFSKPLEMRNPIPARADKKCSDSLTPRNTESVRIRNERGRLSGRVYITTCVLVLLVGLERVWFGNQSLSSWEWGQPILSLGGLLDFFSCSWPEQTQTRPCLVLFRDTQR